MISPMHHELRLAVRALLKTPGFTAIALVTLTLGIAASAAAFSILYAVLLRPLPYPDPDRLVILFGRDISTDRFADWQQRATSYDAFAALVPGLPNVDTRDGVKVVLDAGWVHLRRSNTEPIVRAIAESRDAATAAALVQRALDQLAPLARTPRP